MKRICGIYRITNKLNGKSYIGQSKDIMSRWQQHIWHSEKHDINFILSNALRKYGKDMFIWEILEECPQDELNQREIFYINKYRTYIGFDDCDGYNMTLGGDGYRGGMIPVDKYDLQGNYICTYSSISEAARLCNIHKTQITQCCKLTKGYNSAGGFQWRYKGEEPPVKYRYRGTLHILQYSKDGVFIKEYESCEDAAKSSGLSSGYIASCCRHPDNSNNQYIWRYKE